MRSSITEGKEKQEAVGHYADIGGMKMYYEIHGKGEPLVLIHGGGSTIETSFGKILPSLARNRQLIAVELQGHGRTAYREKQETFNQDAVDVAELMLHLKIGKADFFGFSNGGNAVIQIAINYPQLVRKLVLASTFFKRSALPPQFWDAINNATLENMPQPLKDAYVKVAPDPGKLPGMFLQDKTRMVLFQGWTEEDIKGINAPSLVIQGDSDVVLPEHAVEMYRLLPHAQLVILPGLHGEYMGEVTTPYDAGFITATSLLLENFLRAQMT